MMESSQDRDGGHPSQRSSRRSGGTLLIWMLLIGVAGWSAFGPSLKVAYAASDAPSNSSEVRDSYTYDVSPDGLVRVTVHPRSARSLFLPITAEKLEAEGLNYDLKKNWEKYRCEITLSAINSDPTLSYEWPDGALPWPEKVSEWLQDSEKRWCTDNFYTAGPAEVTIILPAGTEVLEYRERDCPKRTETGEDGKVRVIFDVPAGKEVRWLGVVYRFPWAPKYAVYGKSPMPLYYPAVMGRYPEYMAKVKQFYEACQEFYRTYKSELKWAPPFDVEICLVSWIQGYGGAYTSGKGIHFDYRRLMAFEYPPVKDGGNLMGAYHEIAHIFQPGGYPEFIGGHTWSAYLTMDYDWNAFPTVAEVAKRKQQGGSADREFSKAYPMFLEFKKKGILPGLWYRWPESPEVESQIKAQNCPYGLGALHEKAEAYAMLKLERDFGKDFWGKYADVFIRSGISYDVDEPVKQKLVAAQMSVAAGRDLTSYLSKLTGCDLAVTLNGEGENLLSNGGMESDGDWSLQSWQPGARLEWDTKTHHSGKRSLRLSCPEANDARAGQSVSVEPGTYYLLTAWVRTENIEDGTSGASICVSTDIGSQHLTGSGEWKQLALPVYSGDRREMQIELRLGWPGRPTAGTAWFDNVELIPLFSKNGWQRLLSLGDESAYKS